MDVTILAVGKIKDCAYLQKTEDYLDRIRHDAKLAVVEIKDSDPETEGAKLRDHCRRLRPAGRVIALDERGRSMSSVEFARKLSTLASRKIVFLIGGPLGLSEKVRSGADELFSLSPLTFTHEIARLLLAEQLYRAISILKNRRYHKA